MHSYERWISNGVNRPLTLRCAGVCHAGAAPARRGRRAGRSPADCQTVSELKALVAADSKRQGVAWHAATLAQLGRVAGAPAGGAAAAGRSAGARRDAEALAVHVAAAIQKGLARAAPEDLGAAAAALAGAQGVGNTRPALQAALRALEAAILPQGGAGGGSSSSGSSSSSSSSSCGGGGSSSSGSCGAGGGVEGWRPPRLAAAARGLAAAAGAGEDFDEAAADAVAAACCKLASGDGGVIAEVRAACAALARVAFRGCAAAACGMPIARAGCAPWSGGRALSRLAP